MPQIKSSFTLNSKYPLDIRDSFDTLEELKNPGILFDEGHITYCKETGKHYIYDDKYWNNLSGYFKEFVISGGSTPEDIQSILDSKVDKEEGKGLSTNDFTNDYKSTLDNLDLNTQILPEYKEECVLWSNYEKTLEWTDRFNSVDHLDNNDNPISQRAFTAGQNKRIVYQKWADAFNDNMGGYPIYIMPNGYSMYIMEPLNTEVENPENPEEPGVLSEICIYPVPLLTIDNPKIPLCNIYNHEIIFTTGENIPDVSYIDSMGFELLWEKSAPILEPNKIYKISFDTSMVYNPETFENDNMIITGRWVELIGGNATYGLRKPNIKEFFDMMKEKREVK